MISISSHVRIPTNIWMNFSCIMLMNSSPHYPFYSIHNDWTVSIVNLSDDCYIGLKLCMDLSRRVLNLDHFSFIASSMQFSGVQFVPAIWVSYTCDIPKIGHRDAWRMRPEKVYHAIAEQIVKYAQRNASIIMKISLISNVMRKTVMLSIVHVILQKLSGKNFFNTTSE